MTWKTHPHPILTEQKALASLLTSADTYADVDTWETIFFATAHFRFTAVTNNLDVQILASIDGGLTYPIVEVAEFALVVGTDQSKTVTTYYTHLKVQVKPTVSATHGTLQTRVAGASF